MDNMASLIESSSENAEGHSLPEWHNAEIDTDNLTEEQLLRVRQVLGNWKHAFSSGPFDLGRTDLVQHRIELIDDRPFKQPYRKVPPGMHEESASM